MKQVLIIAYYFSPAAVVGTNRIRRFVKHLPKSGWKSTVLTVREDYYDVTDDTLNIPVSENWEIHRTPMIVFSDPHRIHERNVYGGLQAIRLRYKETNNRLRKALQIYFSIPDTRAGWIPSAVTNALKIMRSEKMDAILTTSFPYSSHVIGLALKLTKNIHWVADFRDPWAEYAFLYPNTQLHKTAAYWLEKQVVRNADVIIANTPSAQSRLQERYPEFAKKTQCIPNGYDEEDFVGAKNCGGNFGGQVEKFVILHAGTIQGDKERRYPEAFFQAVSDFIKKHPSIKGNLVIKFIGHLHYDIDLNQLAKQYEIEDCVIQAGWFNHEQTVKEMLLAQVLLLIHHSQQAIDNLVSTVPAKTYEYLAAKKPILCLSANGVVTGLIEKAQIGLSTAPLNKSGILSALENLYFNYNQWISQALESDFHKQFEATQLTHNLALLLDNGRM
jgi:glycosyltransferase involved in cell wall biosynthesis